MIKTIIVVATDLLLLPVQSEKKVPHLKNNQWWNFSFQKRSVSFKMNTHYFSQEVVFVLRSIISIISHQGKQQLRLIIYN